MSKATIFRARVKGYRVKMGHIRNTPGSQPEIKVIARDCVDCEHRAVEMYDKWLRKNPSSSWMKIIAALEGMLETSLANRLRKKYHKQLQDHDQPATTSTCTSEEQQATGRELKVDKKDLVARELDRLEKIYLRLLINAQSTMVAANPSVIELEGFSQFYFYEEVTTVKELFKLIKRFCFLDYAVLETAISFLIDPTRPVVSDLTDYIQQLTNFKNSTTLKEFIESIENAQKSLSSKEGAGVCTVTLRLVGGWLDKTMEDLDKLLKEIFQDKSSVLAHIKITKGSVIVTFLAPLSQADSLIRLARSRFFFMANVGVCGLRIGNTTIIDTSSETMDFFSFESFLNIAVISNNIKLLEFLLDINTNPDATDDKGYTVLMYGSSLGRDRAVNILLKANANPNLQKKDGGNTPLHMAARKGHSDIITNLLQANANPNLPSDDGTTPLHMTAKEGHLISAINLLKGNANPNLQKKSGTTPLFVAAQKGHSDIVSILLQANANANLQAENGISPLHVAVDDGHYDTACILLQANANPNLPAINGYTPLMSACLKRYHQIVQLLLSNGADPNLRHSNGTNALMCASYTGCLESTELLLMSGADHLVEGPQGLTATKIAVHSGHNDIADLIQAIEFSQSSTTSPVLTPQEIATSTDNEAMAILNKEFENMLVAKVESYISTYYEKTKQILPSKSDQDIITQY